MRARHELALNLIRENGDCKIHQATLLIAATVISDLLKNLDPTSLSRSLKDEPLALIRLLNSLSRLSHHGIKCERQREQDVERKASSDQFRSSLKAAGIIA